MNSSIILRYRANISNFVSKWNLTAAAIVAFCAFFIILTIAINEVLHVPPKHRNHPGPDKGKPLQNQDRIIDDYCNLSDDCVISCYNIYVTEIATYDAFNNIQECNRRIDLILNDCIFEDDAINYQWLILPENIYINSLVINSNIIDITEKAFLGDSFKYLTQLQIVNTDIEYLRKDMFVGLDRLESFLYRMDKMVTVVKVEDNLFEEVANTLTILEFTGLRILPEFLQNVTGNKATTSLTNLVTFSLQDNMIEKIEGGSFRNAPNLIQLYLARCSLEELDVGAFVGANNIRTVDLNSNFLRTFPNNIFAPLHVSETSKPRIWISQNRFNCNCDLQWFKNFYKTSGYFNGTDFYCLIENGNTEQWLPYTEVDFCSSPESTSENSNTQSTTDRNTQSTEPEGTTTTDSPPDDDLNTKSITCVDFGQVDLQSLTTEFNMTIKTRTVSFDFVGYSRNCDSSPGYSINFQNKLDSDYILLLSSENKEHNCTISSDSVHYFLKDLRSGEIYTVCMMSKASTTVSPENCASLLVPVSYKDQEWIRNKDKPLIIGLTCCICLSISLLSGLVVFYTIRQHPKLIKSSKKVIVVKKKKTADLLIMPQYDTQSNTARSIPNNPPPSPSLQSVASSRSDGYMTPHPPSKVFNVTPKNGCSCCSYEYFNACEYQQRRRRISQTLDYNCIQNSDAPPLPPNHPIRKF